LNWESALSEARDYPLGYSDLEAGRLADQGALLEGITEDVFRRAGLKRGMRVLDIGSGVGDVSLLAARMIGGDGAVLGIDKSSSSVQAARRRVADLGVTNVRFEKCDIADSATEQKFDAIIGRLVLLYLPDPAAELRRLSRTLRPDGIVAFQEIDMSEMSQVPASDLFMKMRR
jgi:ubiquinone/menaquinone biosynthesis C-methylase UbiE